MTLTMNFNQNYLALILAIISLFQIVHGLPIVDVGLPIQSEEMSRLITDNEIDCGNSRPQQSMNTIDFSDGRQYSTNIDYFIIKYLVCKYRTNNNNNIQNDIRKLISMDTMAPPLKFGYGTFADNHSRMIGNVRSSKDYSKLPVIIGKREGNDVMVDCAKSPFRQRGNIFKKGDNKNKLKNLAFFFEHCIMSKDGIRF